MNFLDRALPLWERGWNVIPIPPGEKGCFFKGWQRLSGKERATRTQLEEWNAKEPRLNVGVMACPKTICILDFDNMETVERILAETGTPAPVTFEVRLPAGLWRAAG